MADIDALRAKMKTIGDHVRTLKAQGAPKEQVDAEVAKLQEAKKELSESTGEPLGEEKGKKGRMALKTPKGTRDWAPSDMALREHIFSTLARVFKKHGGSNIDTPVFELKEILAGKYGEDSKLIYDLQDQGGELCSLRYDLTVPFARFLAMNPTQYANIKRYHIAKVYRRDQPVMTKGRMREFYQCDFDIAGHYDSMVPDAEILCIVCEALTELEIGDFTVKINHRKILDGIFAVCGVPAQKIRSISSAIDKLDKLPWVEVRKEMTEEKGLDPEVADRIGKYVMLKGGPELLDRLKKTELANNKMAKQGMDDMELLFAYLDVYGISDKMSFDLSLARGLDYYTGIIYEAVTQASAPPGFSTIPPVPPPESQANGSHAGPSAPSSKPPKKSKKDAEGEEEVDETTVGVGSIAAGGRYDELVGMFLSAASGASGSAKKAAGIPCVGISVGVERVFSILHQKSKHDEESRWGRSKETEVFIVAVAEGLLPERMKLAKELWDAGIKAEFMQKAKPKFRAQFDLIDKERVPFAVLLGPDELKNGIVKVKVQKGKDETKEDEGEVVKRDDLVSWLKQRL
ncbi:histidyl-tRNA synthetase [Calocera viscosa TUFC12733]|uniref:histidine--tRNA ligase n=1 Tax=Calocera viscosa (strain TUFC12733) TaxID=1330018 RepID=A0A167M7P4_CALVF|nr:histidyl-tRNA synthetase [Calocera viscosa TUFC12733]